MSGKKNTKRQTQAREVTLKVDGAEVNMNGFVMDVFQEMLTGLVRTLGNQDPDKRIELVVGEAKAE